MSSQIETEHLGLNRDAFVKLSEPFGSNLESILGQVATAIDQHDLPKALRFADRARRIASKNSSCVLLYAQLLIKSGFSKEALNHLTDESDPNIVLARGMAFYELGLREEATQCCAELLKGYSVDAIEGLSAFAERLSQGQGSIPNLGWIGVNPSGAIWRLPRDA
ncbi:MAG: hypothetical protein ABSF53_27115 [Terracidiphilus sp.]